MSPRHFAAIALAALALSLALTAWLYRDAHPFGGISLPVSSEDIVARAQRIGAERFGPAWQNARLKTTLVRDIALLRQLQTGHGLSEANALQRSGAGVYSWDVTLTYDRRDGIRITTPRDEQREAFQQAARAVQGDARLRFDVNGRLVDFTVPSTDSAARPVSFCTSRETATAFLTAYAPADLLPAGSEPIASKWDGLLTPTASQTDTAHLGTAVRFSAALYSPAAGDSVTVSLTVHAGAVSTYRFETVVPAQLQESGFDIPAYVLVVLTICALVVSLIVFFIRRLRSYEIGWKTGLYMAVIAAAAFAAEVVETPEIGLSWEVLLVVLVTPVFVGLAVAVVWPIGESVAREAMKPQLFALDLLFRGRFLHSEVGKGVLGGIAAGAAAAALWLLLVRLAGLTIPLWIVDNDKESLAGMGTFSPAVLQLSRHTVGAIFTASALFLFVVSAVRRRVASLLGIVVLGALPFAVLNGQELHPWPLGIAVELVIGAALVWTLLRVNALALLIALCGSELVLSGSVFFTSGNAALQSEGLTLAVFAAVLIAWALAALLTKDPVTDPDSIAPAFALRISERVRLQRELEVARDVQMSFLPKATPDVEGLDIAARCIPALEVGGDYYDFLDLGPRSVGVAIGDVSGKGTQAAFYMTLTKGFLRALSRRSNSPAAVLREMNGLFYENVERGHFVSMIYAVFDLDLMTVRIGRAGHNPPLRLRPGGAVDVIRSSGVALGCDVGEKFDIAMRETEIPLARGDVFLFYTDGITEAMTREREEFGEERLSGVLKAGVKSSARDILDALFGEVGSFAGKAPQHDDMTVVLVRIL